MDSLIRTEHIGRIFPVANQKIVALKDINIHIDPGTLTILRGRSGSGKTTLMNILGTLDRPTDGQVFFQDQEITHLTDDARDNIRRTQMGFIFQSVALMGQMSAYENVEFGLRIAGYPAKKRRDRAVECLDFVGLKQRMNHRPGELSGGEQQRVAIARAIAHLPKVIFADEPTAELDTAMALKVMALLRNLVEKEGVTILMTTHDPSMMELGDHVYSLLDGEITGEDFHDFSKPKEG